MPQTLYLLFFIEIIFVFFLDIKYRKISNIWSILNIFGFVLFLFLFPKIYFISWKLFLYPTLILSIGFLLFLIHIAGAGDIKYLSSLMVLLPQDLHPHFLEIILMATIVVASIILFYEFLKFHRKGQGPLSITELFLFLISFKKSKFPYTIVIFIGWCILGIKLNWNIL